MPDELLADGMFFKSTLAMRALSLASLSACSAQVPVCPAGGPTTIEATVKDALNGNVCDALVTVTEGASTLDTSKSSDPDASTSCRYDLYFKGAEGARTYTVTATAPGFAMAQVTSPAISFDSCGHAARTEKMTIKLLNR